MDYEKTIRSLKRQLLIERIVFGVIAVMVLAVFIAGRISNGKSVIVVDGKPVVCVNSAKDANRILENIKKDSGANPLETEFKQEVRIARAPRSASPMPTSRAMSVARSVISPVINRWAIIADGKPVVGLPSRDDAAKTLELTKAKFGSQVPNLSEEPQIKENISIAVAAISPEQYCTSPDSAVKYLFTPKSPERKDALYTVKEGDVAVGIARKLNLKPDELKKLNPGINLDKLAIGSTLKVKQTEKAEFPLTVIVRNLVTKTQPVPVPMTRVSSPSMYEGKMAYISRGKPGKRTVDIAMVYENGRLVGQEIISEEVLVQPVAGKLAIGIKPRP